MSWIWGIVLLVVLLFGLGLTPWEAIEQVLTNGGVDEEGAAIIGFVAGYTFPPTIGFAVLSFVVLVGAHK